MAAVHIMLASNLFLLVVACLVTIIDTLTATTLKYTEQSGPDLNCNTCEFAIKELDLWLRMTGKKGHYSLEAAIAKSLESVCNTKDSVDTEIRPDTNHCREFLEEHGLVIKEALVEHYESDEPGSYLKLIQEVCHGKMNLCGFEKQTADEAESSIELNPDTNEMEVSFSGSIKTVNPVKESN